MHPYLETLQSAMAPLIQGEQVTFIWQGESAPALITDLYDWENNPVSMERIDDEIWIYTLHLSRQAYLEYAYMHPESGERLPDPFNSRRVSNGIGKINNYFYMPEAHPNPLTNRMPGVPRGLVSRHSVPTFETAVGKERAVYLYQPPVETPCPLIVVYDGQDFVKRGRIPVILDNLIAMKRIQPVALAMVAHGGKARSLEYACNDMTLGFLAYAILPLAQQELNLVDIGQSPGAFGILGASMSGMMALYSAWRMPEIFGSVASLSGAFAIPEHSFVINDLIRYAPIPQLRVWLGVGKYEWLVEANRSMHTLLDARNMKHHYLEFYGGHNYTSWRDHIWRGFEYLFPPTNGE